jgi:hypothetical protein
MPHVFKNGQKKTNECPGRRKPLDGNRIADELTAYAVQIGLVFPHAARFMWKLSNDLRGRDLIVDRGTR